MKSIQAQHYSEKFQVTTCPDLIASDDQILISIKVAGVNPVDTYIAAGTNNYTTTFPHTPGKDAAGIILALGSNVSGFEVGQRVYCAGTLTGANAELALATPNQVFLLPDTLSFEQGACLGTVNGRDRQRPSCEQGRGRPVPVRTAVVQRQSSEERHWVDAQLARCFEEA